MRVGIEVGGTFTDLVAIEGGRVRVLKTPSTPASPDIGAFAALAESGLDPAQIAELAHGSTTATNAVLERKGFPVAFVTTEGFRDILSLQRHGRARIYDLAYAKPVPVVERAASFEVAERVLADGTVLRALDEAAVEAELIPRLAGGGYEAVAICLLNAYANPAHERRLKAMIEAGVPGLLVTISSEVTREFREFERASTTTLSAYVQPVIDRYLARFARRLADAGFAGQLSMMQSNGGRLPVEGMRGSAVTALLSGPAAGVMGAARQAGRSGYADLITLDIGGTSTDVSVVSGAKPHLTQEFQIDGLPVRIPALDINTVGAGGGSLVWVDDGGMLRVGPQSAGADPGPACYGRGGRLPTITDAHVVRGTIRPDAFLGGRMTLDAEAARAALTPVARRFAMSLEDAADAAIRLANANIVRAIQIISTERGHDPRDYALVPYGGAGPLHAAAVAEDLGIRTIVAPPNAGVMSAYGLIASDTLFYESLTRRAALDSEAPALVRAAFAEMSGRARARAAAMGLAGGLAFELTVEMRFLGQAFEVPVTLTPADLEGLTAETLARRFGDAHQRMYLFGAGLEKPIELVSFRLAAVLPIGEVPLLSEAAEEEDAAAPRAIEMTIDRVRRTGALQRRASLVPGRPVVGPALLEDATATLLVPPGWQAMRDAADNVILTRSDSDA